jgi:hypothetical protein
MRRRIFIALLALALLAATPVSAAPASTPAKRITVAGVIQFALAFDANGNPEVTETPLPDNKCLVHVRGDYLFFGSLEGSGPAALEVRSFGPCGYPPFTFAEHGDIYGTFNGTVAGRSGTFDYHYTFKLDKGERWLGRITILSGTGELASLHGKLDIVSTDTATQDPYTGWVSFGD